MTIDEAIQRYADNAEYERTHCINFQVMLEWHK